MQNEEEMNDLEERYKRVTNKKLIREEHELAKKNLKKISRGSIR